MHCKVLDPNDVLSLIERMKRKTKQIQVIQKHWRTLMNKKRAAVLTISLWWTKLRLPIKRYLCMPLSTPHNEYVKDRSVIFVAAGIQQVVQSSKVMITPYYLNALFFMLHQCPFSDFNSRFLRIFAIGVQDQINVLCTRFLKTKNWDDLKATKDVVEAFERFWAYYTGWNRAFEEFHDKICEDAIHFTQVKKHYLNASAACEAEYHESVEKLKLFNLAYHLPSSRNLQINTIRLEKAAALLQKHIEAMVSLVFCASKRNEIKQKCLATEKAYDKGDASNSDDGLINYHFETNLAEYKVFKYTFYKQRLIA